MSVVTIKLGEAFSHIRNGMNIKQHDEAGGLPITRIETISDGVVNPVRVGYAGLTSEDARKWFLKPGDILFSHINSFEHVGKIGVYRGTPDILVHGMNLLCLRPDAGKIDTEYAKHLLRTKLFRSRLERFVNKAVNQASVSIGNLSSIEIPLPPLDEQRRIAAMLDKAEELRVKRRAAIALLDQLPQAIFLETFGDPATNPNRWPVQHLRLVAQLENGDRSAKYPSGSDIVAEGIPFISTKNIVESMYSERGLTFITEEKFRQLSQGKVMNGDLLITLRGTLGQCCIFASAHRTGFINAQLMIIRPGEYLTPKYLHSLLVSKSIQRKFAELGHGGAVPQLTGKQIGDLPVIIPPIDLQHRFAARVEAIHRAKAAHQSALTQLDTLFASLQNKAFNGGFN